MVDNKMENDLRTAEETFQKIFGTADQARADNLEQLSVVRQTKALQWKRERTRLRGLLGANHPLVKELTQRMETNGRMLEALEIVTEQAKTKIPNVGKDAWAVHGHVRGPALKTRTGLTVAFYDRGGNWLREFGYAQTDKSGHFVLQSVSKTGAQIKEVYLHVLDRKRATLYVDPDAIAPEPGRTYYRGINIAEDEVGEWPAEQKGQPKPKGRKAKH